MNPAIILALIRGPIDEMTDRIRRAVVDYTLAAVFGLVGVIFLIVAGFIYAVRFFTPLEAALGFGVGFIVLSLLMLLVHRLRSGGRTSRARARKSNDMKAAASAVAVAALPAILSRKAGLSSLIVPGLALLGFMIYREARSGKPDLT